MVDDEFEFRRLHHRQVGGLRTLENSAGIDTGLPHLGSATIEGRIDMGEKVIINIRAFTDGHRPPDRVLPSML